MENLMRPAATCSKATLALLAIFVCFTIFPHPLAAVGPVGLVNENYSVISQKIIVQGKQGTKPWEVAIASFHCDGTFSIPGGELEDVSGFGFSFPVTELLSELAKVNPAVYEIIKNSRCREFSFKQNKSMILPVMKVVHLVGEAETVTGNQAAPIQLTYEPGPQGEVKFTGKLVMALSGFVLKEGNIIAGTEQNEITIVIEVTLAKGNLGMLK